MQKYGLARDHGKHHRGSLEHSNFGSFAEARAADVFNSMRVDFRAGDVKNP